MSELGLAWGVGGAILALQYWEYFVRTKTGNIFRAPKLGIFSALRNWDLFLRSKTGICFRAPNLGISADPALQGKRRVKQCLPVKASLKCFSS